jgi:hypothetical protein
MQRVGRCRCRECVRSGSDTLLSYYLRKKHENQYGLATDDALVTNALSETMNRETTESPGQQINTDGTDHGHGQETQNESVLIDAHDQDEPQRDPSDDEGSLELSSSSMVAGPLLDWYRQSRGLLLTRERMDSLLHLLRVVEPSLPRQVRTLERRELHQTPDEFAVNNMKRSIVCGGCALCEITECVSQCQFLSFNHRSSSVINAGKICLIRQFVCPRCSLKSCDFEAAGYTINGTFHCPNCGVSTKDDQHAIVAYTLSLVIFFGREIIIFSDFTSICRGDMCDGYFDLRMMRRFF